MAPCAALLAVLAVNTFAANALLPPQQLRVTAHRSAATARRLMQLDGPSEFDVAEGDEATAAAMRSMMKRAAKEERRAAANSDPVAPFTGMDDRRVPASQEPVNELAIVRSQFLMDWAELPLGALLRNLGVAFGGTFALVGLPIVNNYDEYNELVNFTGAQTVAFALLPAALVLAALMTRLFAAWYYLGERLTDEELYFEESGWYDGFMQVKPARTLYRDKLLFQNEVQPALRRITPVAAGSAALFVAVTVANLALGGGGEVDDGYYHP